MWPTTPRLQCEKEVGIGRQEWSTLSALCQPSSCVPRLFAQRDQGMLGRPGLLGQQGGNRSAAFHWGSGRGRHADPYSSCPGLPPVVTEFFRRVCANTTNTARFHKPPTRVVSSKVVFLPRAEPQFQHCLTFLKLKVLANLLKTCFVQQVEVISKLKCHIKIKDLVKLGWRGGSIGRLSDSRSKDPRFEPRQDHKKNL